jgi:glutamate synthase domain-containing protein 3
MTGGCAVILGPTGRNFAAGMSGGSAFVYDAHDALLGNCNLEMVELEKVVAPEDVLILKDLLAKHHKYTGSTVASAILQDWDDSLAKFVKVMPIDYKRALAEQKKELAKA